MTTKTKAKGAPAKGATTLNREAWLTQAVEDLRPLLKQAGAVVPDKVAVSVGFPTGSRKRIGECWSTKNSNGINHIFISPQLVHPVEVLSTLAHELIHASDDCASKHNGHFRRVATIFGFTGKMTATVPDQGLIETFKQLGDEIGNYPHEGLNRGDRPKQNTRLIKMECGCGLKIRVTQKWIDEYGGRWVCPCGDHLYADNWLPGEEWFKTDDEDGDE